MPSVTTKRPNETIIDGGGHGPIDRWGDGGDGGGDRRPEPERTPPPEGYRLSIWLMIVSVTSLFLTLSVLYIYNQAGKRPIVTPGVLWVSSGLILASSLTIEFARRALRRRKENGFRLWIIVTMALGSGFLISQLSAWQRLQEAGFYLSGNFHSTYAYIFTALHGIHLIAGLCALGFIALRSPESWTAVRRRVTVDAATLFWHFLDGLWIYLLVFLFLWKG